MFEDEQQTSDSSDDEGPKVYFKKNEWLWNKDKDEKTACFVCWRSGVLRKRKKNSRRQADTDSNAGSGEEGVDKAEERLEKDQELRKCSADGCKVLFHEKCFLDNSEGDFLPNMHILDKYGVPCYDPPKEAKKWYCPRHECNACHQELLRTRSQLGSLITCTRCEFAWHKSCVIVGSHYVNRKLDNFVLCPRHTEITKESKVHTPYCVGCESRFDGKVKIECSTCVRAFCETCWNKDVKVEGCTQDSGKSKETEKSAQEKETQKAKRTTRITEEVKNENAETVENGEESDECDDEPVCGFCTCYDLPRIGDHVLAVYKRRLYPAVAVHADQIPRTLENNIALTKKLENEGYVLIRWIEGLSVAVSNYAVTTFREVVAVPKSFDCSFWRTIKEQNVYEAMRKLYANKGIPTGIERPLPMEVKEAKKPLYRRIDTNDKGRRANKMGEPSEHCQCEPVNGLRCTRAHNCLNRIDLAECPEDCDADYVRRKTACGTTRRGGNEKRDEKRVVAIPEGKCMNNFLRNHKREHDEQILEERMTEKKFFGVFAKTNLPRGTDLTEYLGEVLTKEEYLERMKLYNSFNNLESGYYGIQLGCHYLDGRQCGGFARTINHSCNPNCIIVPVSVDGVDRLLVTTIKDVRVGEEITFDYATRVIEGVEGAKCYCGADNCRSFIRRGQAMGAQRTAAQQGPSGTAKRGRRPGKRGRKPRRELRQEDRTRRCVEAEEEKENPESSMAHSSSASRKRRRPPELNEPGEGKPHPAHKRLKQSTLDCLKSKAKQ